ncbi:MAG: hypothetical protein J6Y02_10730 [Pseudobutyrivibrio sp.]|nr:hypothetical protein [Pseudobutyrivibrio sp.]
MDRERKTDYRVERRYRSVLKDRFAVIVVLLGHHVNMILNLLRFHILVISGVLNEEVLHRFIGRVVNYYFIGLLEKVVTLLMQDIACQFVEGRRILLYRVLLIAFTSNCC